MKITVATLLLATVLAGCGGKKSAPASPGAAALSITLDRAQTGSDVLVTVHVSSGGTPTLAVSGGSASTLVDAGGGEWTATVTPDALDAELPITAAVGGVSATEIALPFTTVDPAWGQAVAVDGMVNTEGFEDSVGVSADGQWLIVSTYIPADVGSCLITDGGDPTAAACQTLVGPTSGPERPGMLGGERISGTTYTNDCPDLGITTPSTTVAFLPTAAYGFHRQTDGSFAEPFVIGFDADGCLGPYGFDFTGPEAGNSAGVVFAYQDPLGSGKANITYTPLTLGAANILGTYRVSGGAVVESGSTTTVLPPVLATRQGNPAYGLGALWWDDEDLPTDSQVLYYANVTGTIPNLTVGSAMTVGVNLAGSEQIQPSLDGNTLYWTGNAYVWSATLTPGATISSAGSWSARSQLLGPAPNHQILGVGEPNVAHVGGNTELYFVYSKKTATGYDSNVGKIVAR